MNRSCAVAALALAAATAFSAPASADWYYRPGWSPGAAAAVGALGRVAVGAAIAPNARPGPAARGGAPPPSAEECFVERRRVFVPGYGWEMRRRTVCE